MVLFGLTAFLSSAKADPSNANLGIAHAAAVPVSFQPGLPPPPPHPPLPHISFGHRRVYHHHYYRRHHYRRRY